MYCSEWMIGIRTLHKQLIYQTEYYIIYIEFKNKFVYLAMLGNFHVINWKMC